MSEYRESGNEAWVSVRRPIGIERHAVRWMRAARSSKAGQTDDGLQVTESRNLRVAGQSVKVTRE